MATLLNIYHGSVVRHLVSLYMSLIASFQAYQLHNANNFPYPTVFQKKLCLTLCLVTDWIEQLNVYENWIE